MKVQVPGSICITPTAPVLDTSLLLKPLSWSAIASASDDDTPLAAATWPTSAGLTVSGVGCAPPEGALEAAGAPAADEPERLSVVPASSSPRGSSPLAAAS